MPPTPTETLPIAAERDIVLARQKVRGFCQQLGFSLVDQTKMITAASEIARNTLIYGGGGRMHAYRLDEAPRRGLRLVFEDEGPGIEDMELALKDGWTSGGGLGKGLSGSRRLVNEFDISSAPGQGTRVTLVRWK